MPKITAIMNVDSPAPHLEQSLASLAVCDEVVLIHASDDKSVGDTAKSFGVTLRKAIPGVTPGAYIMDSQNDWILVIRPNEELNQQLIQSLSDWKQGDHEESGYAFEVCEKTGEDTWCRHLAEMRLVNRKKINWVGELPPNNTMAQKLPGDILRYPL